MQNITGADGNCIQQTSMELSGVDGNNNNTDENGERVSTTQENCCDSSVADENATNLDSTQPTSMDTSVPPEQVDSTPVIDISQSNDEMLNLLKVNKKPRHHIQLKPKIWLQLKTDVAYGANFNSFKNKEPVLSAVDFTKAFNKLFKRTEVIFDDGNQLCTYVHNYLQLSPQNMCTSVMQYILHNMDKCTQFAKNFDFMKTITLERYTSILIGPHVKLDEFSICILSQALRIHIYILFFQRGVAFIKRIKHFRLQIVPRLLGKLKF